MSLSDITHEIAFISDSEIGIDSSLLIGAQCCRLLLNLMIMLVVKLVDSRPRRWVRITHNPYVLVPTARPIVNVTRVSGTTPKYDWRLLTMFPSVIWQLLLWAIYFLYQTLHLVGLDCCLLRIETAAFLNKSVTRGLLWELYHSSVIGMV